MTQCTASMNYVYQNAWKELLAGTAVNQKGRGLLKTTMQVYIADVKELSVQNIDTRLKDDDDTSYHILTKEKLCMI